jgi:hypothetical protein
MGKYETGYPRLDRDFYPTPAWVIEALAEQVELPGKRILECACGDGRMARALEAAGACVTAFDIADYGYGGVRDFLSDEFPEPFDGTITNPPYGPRGKTAEAFIETGIRRLGNGFLAFLLPADFDSAVTRRRFFDECAAFTAKIILTRRVKWFQTQKSCLIFFAPRPLYRIGFKQFFCPPHPNRIQNIHANLII